MYQFNIIHRKLDGTEITKEEVIAIFKKRPAIEIQMTRRSDDVRVLDSNYAINSDNDCGGIAI